MNEWMKKGPLEWKNYTYKEVRVTASEKEYKGWVLTTDPVSAKWVMGPASQKTWHTFVLPLYYTQTQKADNERLIIPM